MNALTRFAITFIGFVCLIALILAIIASMSPHATRVDYYDGMHAKHERLHALVSPKVVIIGGSSATFGIDSDMLEKALCRPVVNMSIHAALGFGFMVREIEGEIDGYTSKAVGLFLLPVITLAIYLLFTLIPYIAVFKKNMAPIKTAIITSNPAFISFENLISLLL